MRHPSGSRYGQNAATRLVSRRLYPSIKEVASIPYVLLFHAYYPERPCYEVQMDLLPGVYEWATFIVRPAAARLRLT